MQASQKGSAADIGLGKIAQSKDFPHQHQHEETARLDAARIQFRHQSPQEENPNIPFFSKGSITKGNLKRRSKDPSSGLSRCIGFVHHTNATYASVGIITLVLYPIKGFLAANETVLNNQYLVLGFFSFGKIYLFLTDLAF